MWKVGRTSALWVMSALLLGGCGGGDPLPSTEGGSEVRISSFEASTDRLELGETLTLSWETRNASAVQLYGGGAPIELGDAFLASGSVQVQPERSVIYRLEARGADGSVASRERAVLVTLPDPPQILRFTASPEVFGPGDAVTLSWQTQGAGSIAIVALDGRRVDVSAVSPEEGSIAVSPVWSAAYELVATGPGGSARATAGATLVEPPTARLELEASSIAYGASTLLRWETEDATEIRLYAEGADGDLSTEPNGSLEVSPRSSTTYRLEATGPGGTDSLSQRLGVSPVVESFRADAAEPLRPGSPVDLRWEAKGASSITISNGSGWSYEVPADALDQGTTVAPVGQGGGFVLVAASGPLRAAPVMAQVPLTAEPRIRAVQVEPAAGVTAGRGEEGLVVVSWEVEGADRTLELERIPGGPVNLVERSNRVDSIELRIDRPSDLRLVAINEAGRHEVLVAAPVILPPLVISFEASPPRVAPGESVSLRWTLEDASAVRLERDGVDVGLDPAAVDGSFEENLAAPATYVLYAANTLGFEVASAPLEVELGAPLIVEFAAAAAAVQPGDPLRFRWQSLGGNTLQLVEGAGTPDEQLRCSTSSFSEIRQGGCELTAPALLGSYTYALRVTNAQGTTQDEFELRVSSGPVIRSFTSSEQVIVEGMPLGFGWEVAAGLDGERPSLRLVDDLGVEYPLDGVDPLEDQRSFEISGAGVRTFTLFAEALAPADSTSLDLQVEVIGLPRIEALIATPGFADFSGEEVELSWRTVNGKVLEVYPITAAGVQAGAPICRITSVDEVREGSCLVRPTSEHPDVRVLLEHALGAVVSQDLAIGVRPARITRFEADETELLRGESTTLRWETVWSDEQELGPRFVETHAPLRDLRVMPEGFNFFGDIVDGRVIDFPGAFRFPFFGQEWGSACIFSGGGIQFGTISCGSAPQPLAPFPSGRDFFGRQHFHIAPYLSHFIQRDFSDKDNPQKSIWYALLEDPETGVRTLTFQWSEIASASGDYPGVSVTFQAILHEDGALEFRYGTMKCDPTAVCANRHDTEALLQGQDAIIGYQNPNTTEASQRGEFLHLFPPQTAAVGGLQHRSFKMYPPRIQYAGPVSEEGELEIQPPRSRDFGLFVKNGHSQEEKVLRINVHEPGVLAQVLVEPAEPLPGEPVTLSWAGSELTHLTIRDRDGALVFETQDPTLLADGDYVFEEGLARGDHQFTVRAVGNIARDVIEETVEVLVYEAYSLDSFTTDKELYLPGEPVTLSWSGTGLTSVTIESSRDPVALAPGVDPNGDSITVHPSKLTLYTLHAESHGRVQSLQRVASIRTVQIEELSQSAEVILPSGAAELSWDTQGGGAVSITQLPVTTAAADVYQIAGMDFVEVTSNPAKAFVDISAAGGARLEAASASPFAATLPFPEGFEFPWFGELKSAIRVGANGFLSWTLTEGNTAYNVTKYPTGNANTGNRAFLPFFQAIWTAEPGSIWWKHDAAEGSLTIQWKDWQSNTTAARPSSFNYQVVLFQDGAFEYRYGAMEAASAAYATGQTLTNIGWQNPTSKIGATLSTANQPVQNPADPGSPGPAHRAWRVEPFPSAGSVSVSPTADTEYELCVADDSWRECETRRVSVLGVGQLMFTELMVDPLEGPSGQWFEVRNLSGGAIDLRGLRIRFGTGTVTAQPIHVIGEGNPGEPVLVERGGYKVFSAAPLAGVDSYVYGSGFEFSNTVAAQRMLRLVHPTASTIFASQTWSWTFPTGRSMEVNANRQVFGTSATPNGAVANWCESTSTYGDGSQYGTPGSLGPSCLEAERYLVDAYAALPFIDLEGTGAASIPGLIADTGIAQLPGGMPFAFPFFGASLPAGQPLWLSANGFSQFAELVTDWPSVRTNFPTTSTTAQQGVIDQGVIAPFWVDLRGGAEASFLHAVVSRDGQQVLVLQWTGYERKTNAGRLTFQTQLWENGDIVFSYREIVGGPNYWGASTNVGVEQIGSGGGHLYSQARAQAGLAEGQSILFRRKP